MSGFSEIVKLNPIELSGHVTIEMFDAVTGKKQSEVKGKNFISVKAAELLRRMQIAALTAGVAKYSVGQPVANGYNSSAASWYSPFFEYLVLTDYSSAEASTSDTLVRGNVKGYCRYCPSADANVLAGYANQEESWANPDQAHLVFDFATDKANGTFRSIYLASSFIPGAYSGEYKRDLKCKTVRTYNNPQYADGYFWGSVGNVIYKISMTTGEEVASYDILESVPFFCVTGGAIYYIPAYGTTIKEYVMSSGVKTSLTMPADCNRCTTDGTYVYAHVANVHYSSAYVIVRIAVSTFTIESSKTITPADGVTSYYGWILYIRGGALFGVFYDDKITDDPDTGRNKASIDYEAGTCTQVNYDYPADQILINDGTNDYVFLSNIGFMGSNSYATVNYGFYTTDIASTGHYNIFSRKLLLADVTKAANQTMKISYDIFIS